MNILILGNGFDLAHGLKTTYKDFLDFCQSCIDKNLDDKFTQSSKTNLWMKHFINKKTQLGETWIDLEKEIYSVIKILNKLPTISGSGDCIYFCPQYLRIDDNSSFNFNEIKKYLTQPQKQDNKESLYISGQDYLKNVYIDSPQSFIDFLYAQLREFTELFDVYLQEQVLNNLPQQVPYNLKFQEQSIDNPLYILNFNYTNTFEKLYSNSRLHTKTIYIHGQVSMPRCNMVLGTSSFINRNPQNSNEVYISEKFNVFKKHNQRHKLGTVEAYQDLLYKINEPRKIIYPAFHIIGHSLEETDHVILKHILNANQKAKIYIYYHDEKSEENLINNITKIIGEEAVISKVLFIYQHEPQRGLLKKNKEFVLA